MWIRISWLTRTAILAAPNQARKDDATQRAPDRSKSASLLRLLTAAMLVAACVRAESLSSREARAASLSTASALIWPWAASFSPTSDAMCSRADSLSFWPASAAFTIPSRLFHRVCDSRLAFNSMLNVRRRPRTFSTECSMLNVRGLCRLGPDLRV
jgi:hypothetical protein